MGIVALNAILLRLLFPMLAIGVAIIAKQNNWGLLNNITIPYWLTVIIAVIVLDFIIYLQHVMFHALPLFWRILGVLIFEILLNATSMFNHANARLPLKLDRWLR